MDGDLDGKATQGSVGERDSGEQALAQGHQDAQTDGAQEVGDGGASGGTADYQAALRANDAHIAELQGKVANADKTAEATEALNAEIAALKKKMVDERVEFALRSAGARNVKAAKALLEEHDGDVAALVAAEPWLFEGAAALHKGLHEYLRAVQRAWSPQASRAAIMPPTCAAGRGSLASPTRARRARVCRTTSQRLRTTQPFSTACTSARRRARA
jgi:hypothetical protein